MKKIKDIFSYSIGWGSSGVMCSFCKYSLGEVNQETKKIKSMKCTLHNIILNIQINSDGYIEGEYFCKNFYNTNPFPKAVEEFKNIKNELEENILYEACEEEYLIGISFENLP
jgi:hypothetical protein